MRAFFWGYVARGYRRGCIAGICNGYCKGVIRVTVFFFEGFQDVLIVGFRVWLLPPRMKTARSLDLELCLRWVIPRFKIKTLNPQALLGSLCVAL